MSAALNVDAVELAKFDALAHQYWDAAGPLRTLHSLNPVRAGFIAARTRLADAAVVDVGCGGGLLCEALARHGARVTGIDLSATMIEVARLHAQSSGLAIEYHEQSAASLGALAAAQYDCVCCMELLEHVPEPAVLIGELSRLLRPGGALFVSTINRTAQAFFGAIVAAEYVLGLLPRGTHEYARFVPPAELARAGRSAGLELRELAGLGYDPLTHSARLVSGTAINYLAYFSRPLDPQ